MRELIETLLMIGTPVLLTLFWYDSMKARERAITVCSLTCKNFGAQFLDQTVSLQKIGLRRNPRGRLQFRRSYRFDYSYHDTERYQGSIVMIGPYSELVHIDPPEHFEESPVEQVSIPTTTITQ